MDRQVEPIDGALVAEDLGHSPQLDHGLAPSAGVDGGRLVRDPLQDQPDERERDLLAEDHPVGPDPGRGRERPGVVHDLEGADRLAVPVNQGPPLDLDPDLLDLARERIDHPRVPPLAQVQPGSRSSGPSASWTTLRGS